MTEASAQEVGVLTDSTARTLTRHGAKLLVGVQLFISGVYFLGVLGLLAVTAYRYSGLNFPPFARDTGPSPSGYSWDPKEVLGESPVGYIATGVLAIVALTWAFPALLAAFAGVMQLIGIRLSAGKIHWGLLVSTVVVTACFAVQVTPFGELVRKWMLD